MPTLRAMILPRRSPFAAARAVTRSIAVMSMLTVSAARAGEVGTWERLAPLPVPTGGFVAGAVGDRIVVAGGTNWQNEIKQWLDRVWAYDPARNTWQEIARLDAPVAYAVVGQDANAWWFFGGTTGTGPRPSLWKIDRGLTPQHAASIDGGLVYACGASIGTTLYVVGGTESDSQLDRATGAFLAIDVATGKATRLPDYPEASLFNGAMAASGDRLFVFGGARWDGTTRQVVNHATAHAFSLTTKQWSPLGRLPAANRGLSAVALDGHRILLAGGYTNDVDEFSAEAFVYDPRTDRYSPAKPLPYKGLVGLVKSGDWLYCIGGEDMKKHRTNAVLRIRWRALVQH